MKRVLQINNEADLQWFCIKLLFIFYWLTNMWLMLSQTDGNIVLPVGIYKIYQPVWLFSGYGKTALAALVLGLSLLYLFEKAMHVVTLVQFLLSVIIISYHESLGIFNHATVYSVLFAVQSMAYWQKKRNSQFDISLFRIQYSIQIIAAMYMLAAITKLRVSGIGWINSGELFAIQVVKNYSFTYFGTGNKSALETGYALAQKLLMHKFLIKSFLAFALLLELFCFVVVFSRPVRLVYAFALLAMHAGIKLVMDIPFGMIAPPMIIFFINPLFGLVRAVSFIKGGNK